MFPIVRVPEDAVENANTKCAKGTLSSWFSSDLSSCGSLLTGTIWSKKGISAWYSYKAQLC